MKIQLTVLLTAFSTLCVAQHYYTGKVRRDIVTTSNPEVKNINYTIYTPSDYDYSTTRKYPVIYFLSGSFDQNDWINHGEVNKLFDRMIDDRKIPPFVGIMLCGAAYGSTNWKALMKDYIFKYIESRERIDTTRRSIVGFSLGGYYSLLSICELETNFISAVSFCPIDLGADLFLQDLTKVHRVGRERVDKFYTFLTKVCSPLTKRATSRPIMLLTADRDFALDVFNSIQRNFIKDPVAEIRILDGTHSWKFAISNLEMGLEFVGKQFFFGPDND